MSHRAVSEEAVVGAGLGAALGAADWQVYHPWPVVAMFCNFAF